MTFNKKSAKKFFFYNVISIIIATFVSAIYIYVPTITDTMDGTLRDYMFQVRGEQPDSGNVIIVDIDEKSLKILGQWPWSRNKLAQILINLRDSGISAIGLDSVFAEQDSSSPRKILAKFGKDTTGMPDYDEDFATAVATTPTILGYQFVFEKSKYLSSTPPQIPAIIVERNKQQGLEYILDAKGLVMNLPIIQDNSYSSGFFNNIPDTSGIIRSVPLVISYDGRMYPSLALELIRASMGIKRIDINYNSLGVENIKVGNLTIPTDRHGRIMLNYRGGRGVFKYISAADIYNKTYKKEDIEGKIALLGTSAAGLMDLRATPFDIVFPGVEVHANAIDNIIQGDMLTRPSDLDALNLLIIYIVTVTTVLLLVYAHIWINPFIMAFMIGATIYYMYYKMFSEHIILEITLPIIGIVLATVVTTFMSYMFGAKQEKLIKNKFASKVSKDVMESLLSNPDDMKFQAMEREVTVFFSDVRGFTNISESMPDAKTLIDFMNDYMDPMTDIVIKNKGTVDKYIGDAIMAYWNAPSVVKNHATLALNATLQQLHALRELNIQIRNNPKYEAVVKMSDTNGVEPIDIGIGLNTGVAIVGEMGSTARSDYTVIGDPINLGARLESLCKYYNSKCNISHFTKEQLQGKYIFRFLDLVTVKGKKEPIEIWQVHDWDIEDENKPKLYDVSKEQLNKELELYHNAIKLYKDARFDLALEIFKDLDSWENKTNKNIYKIYTERCELYIEHPPKDFDGVFKHTTKG